MMMNNTNAPDGMVTRVDELEDKELDQVSGGPSYWFKLDGIPGESLVKSDGTKTVGKSLELNSSK